MKNNKGFTLIELLSIIVVVGVIMAYVIPNTITMIERSKRNAYISDTIKFITFAKAEVVKNNKIKLPVIGGDKLVTVINLEYMNISALDQSPFGVPYNHKHSFVAIILNNGQYEYYASLVACNSGANGECKTGDDSEVYIMPLSDLKELNKDKAYEKIKVKRNIEPYLASFSPEEGGTGELEVTSNLLIKLKEITKNEQINEDINIIEGYVG